MPRAYTSSVVGIIWHVLANSTNYADPGSDYFERRNDAAARQRYSCENSRNSATPSSGSPRPYRPPGLRPLTCRAPPGHLDAASPDPKLRSFVSEGGPGGNRTHD
jgi:hypothetical protein